MMNNVTLNVGEVILLLGVDSKYEAIEVRDTICDRFQVCLYIDKLMEIDPGDVREYMRMLP